jgi:hypothetical protein
MPALPMVALALAPYFEQIVAARWLRLTAFTIAVVGGLVLMAAGTYAMLGHSAAADRFVQQRELEELGHLVWLMVLAIGACFVAAALLFRPARGVHALLAGIAALWVIWSVWSYPLLNDSSSAAGVMRRARELAGPTAEIGMVAWKEQNLLMAQGPVRDFGFMLSWDRQYAEAVQWLGENPQQRRLFILEDAMGQCVDKGKAQRVGHANRREWWLFGADAVVAGCTPPNPKDEDADPADR